MIGRQKGAAPQPRVEWLGLRVGVLVQQHDERRQALALASQAVADPRAETRPARLLMSGLKEGDRRIVVDRFGVHRADDADVVGDLSVPWQQVTDPLAGLAVLSKRHERLGDRKRLLSRRHAGQTLAAPNRIGQLLAIQFFQRWLVVERVDLRWGARLAEVDHAFCRGRKMRRPGTTRAVARAVVGRPATAAAPSGSGSSRDASAIAPTPPAPRPKEMTPVDKQAGFFNWVHCRFHQAKWDQAPTN